MKVGSETGKSTENMGKQVCACGRACHTITLLQIGGARSDEPAASPVGTRTVDAGPTCGAQCHSSRPSQQLPGGEGYPPKPQCSGFLLSPISWPKGKGRGGLAVFCFLTCTVVARVLFHSN